MLGIHRTCCLLLALLPLSACQSSQPAPEFHFEPLEPAATAVPSATSAEITVMSYNIRHGEGVDGVFDLPRIAAIINSAEPILVALQEVDSGTTRASGVHQELELAHLTNMQVAFFAEAIPYAGGSYGDAILSRWPVVESEAIPLPSAPNHEKRVAVMVVVEEPSTGRQIRFVGTHLDHTNDPADRVWQVQELNRVLLPATMPTLLVGDLNALPGSAPMQQLFDAGWVAADAELQPTFPSADANKKIDWFLHQPGQRSSLKDYKVLHAPIASDHCPIVVTWVIEG